MLALVLVLVLETSAVVRFRPKQAPAGAGAHRGVDLGGLDTDRLDASKNRQGRLAHSPA